MDVKAEKKTPRDCVVVYCLPGPGESEQWFRSPPSTFTEASKRAAHYGMGLDAFVMPATPYVLDRWKEIPVDPELTARMFRRPAPRLNLVAAVRVRVCPN
jgi:hypothetical protein